MRIGVDLGGTKIEGILLGDSGDILERSRIPTPQGDYDRLLTSVIKLVKGLETVAGQVGIPVGIGTPGAVSAKSGLIKNSNSTALNGRSLREDLCRMLGRPVKIANDADCFTLSEAVDGAAADCNSVFGVILGTGVGGGICINKHLLEGANEIAGEWGHNVLPVHELAEYSGPLEERPCYCGKLNCVETWLSGTGFQNSYFNISGRQLDAREIIKLHEHHDADASELLDSYCRLLALALSVVMNILDPEAIVLGGGMSNIDYLYKRVPEYWERYVFSDLVTTRLLKARYGDSSGVRGAAWLT